MASFNLNVAPNLFFLPKTGKTGKKTGKTEPKPDKTFQKPKKT